MSHTFTDDDGEFVFGPLCANKFYEIEIWVDFVRHCKICKKVERDTKCLKGIKLECKDHDKHCDKKCDKDDDKHCDEKWDKDCDKHCDKKCHKDDEKHDDKDCDKKCDKPCEKEEKSCFDRPFCRPCGRY